jgi:hypothetical protein
MLYSFLPEADLWQRNSVLFNIMRYHREIRCGPQHILGMGSITKAAYPPGLGFIRVDQECIASSSGVKRNRYNLDGTVVPAVYNIKYQGAYPPRLSDEGLKVVARPDI